MTCPCKREEHVPFHEFVQGGTKPVAEMVPMWIRRFPLLRSCRCCLRWRSPFHLSTLCQLSDVSLYSSPCEGSDKEKCDEHNNEDSNEEIDVKAEDQMRLQTLNS
ncbi:hypothetical protein PVK06_044326 [Gossypium arboreum]|uniref:Uncharacterized protein n=1 Tax=Gossypium arboreum TaxID=29729 RepID=A0ABR0MQV5_GOSAR|nr:hypothetical protein PVK06_044326 [Gossypium arboreum]